jgi:Tol biopolymer transport system component
MRKIRLSRRASARDGAPVMPMRRSLLEAATLAAAASFAPPLLAATPRGTAAAESFGNVPVVLREGTNLAIALSPDRRTLAMDLQGILWTLPAGGGTARRLTGDLADIARPDWAPDGRHIVFQSYRDGNFHLWLIGADGTGLRQLDAGVFDSREPRFSPDGKQIAFASDRSGTYGIYALDVASGAVRCVVDSPGEDGEPAWSPDGSRIAFSSNGKIATVAANGAAAAQITVVFDGPAASAPAFTPAGELVYRVTTGTSRDMRGSRLQGAGGALTGATEEAFPVPSIWTSNDAFLYTADGQIKRRSLAHGLLGAIPFAATVHVAKADPRQLKKRDHDSSAPRPVRGISLPVLAPQADRVVFGALNQLWLLDIGKPAPRQLTRDSYAKVYPAWSADGKWLAYCSDRGGKFDIWLRDMDTGAERQLTHVDCAIKQCSWAPDGKSIACACQDGYVNIVDVATGAMRRVLHQLSWAGRPSWSPDGKMLTFAAIQPYSSRYREGISAILVLDLASGATRYFSPEAGVSLDVRNVNGPIWSPAGASMAYTMRGTLWTSPVDASGALAGAPRRLTSESADAISWNSDGSKILYLSNGRLRLLDHADASVRNIPLAFDWTPAMPAATTVVHAGHLWDGIADTLRADVDIVIRANRIAAIEPHCADRAGVTWIDASARTVMPGLIDMHTHREMGNQFGDREPRIFLSYGVTTTRGLSDNPYLMLENRESVDAGTRVGPRHFGTGDALDGSRIFYDGMRSIADGAHLELELERARALDYDLIKCYVRLAPEYQRRATAFAHRHGMAITAHYLFPATAFGADGYEHMGGTSRFGYSRTGSVLGNMYQDVLALTAASGGFRTPTLFGLEPMLGDTPAMVLDDPRVAVLFPAWERTKLIAAAHGGPSQPVPMVANQVDAIRRMMAAGVPVVTGSDYPIVAPGLSIHLNLRAMVRYGVRPVDALRSATSVPGRVLQQDVGSIAPGMLADMVFVDGDPLTDIDAAARVHSVMVGGVLHDVEALIAPYRGKEDGSTAAVAAHDHEQHGMAGVITAKYRSDDGHWWHDPHWVAEVRSSCCQVA